MKAFTKTFLTMALLLGLSFRVAGAEVEYHAWGLPVAVANSSDQKLKALANDLAKVLGQSSPIFTDKNPFCCFWIEIDDWMPNPGEAGYIIQIQPGGARLRATNGEQVAKAIERIKSVVKGADGKVLLPDQVVLTNYRVMEK